VDILTLLAPIFLLIALGAALHRGGLLPSEVLAGLNRLTYWVGLPVLVFASLYGAERGGGEAAGRLLLVLLAVTVVVVTLAWLLARLLGVAVSAQGTFIQAAFRGNLAFVGLPLVLTIPDIPHTPAILALAPMLVVYNVVSVAALLASRHGGGAGVARIVGREVVRNPIIIASVLGGLCYVADWRPPEALDRSLVQLSRMAVPLALLCVGGALTATPLRGNRGHAVAAALLKAFVSPAVGYGMGRLCGLDAGELRIAVIFAACSTAAVSYTMARQFGGDEALAASTVVLSTAFSVPALAAALALV